MKKPPGDVLPWQLRRAEPLLCPLCERPNHFPSDHHFVPRSRGGRETRTICASCHEAIHQSFSCWLGGNAPWPLDVPRTSVSR